MSSVDGARFATREVLPEWSATTTNNRFQCMQDLDGDE